MTGQYLKGNVNAMKLLLAICVIILSGCAGLPDGVEPVKGFEIERYLGKWYEIARLDHSFERGLENVTAEYSLNNNGIRVVNTGYINKEKKWKQAEGKALFVRNKDEGYLKVSFFGPFYGSYVVFELDKESYHYAFVSGPDKSYLWLLSRTPTVSNQLIEKFVTTARLLGFDTDKLVFVKQDKDE